MFGVFEKDNDVTLDVCQVGNEEFWKVLGIVQHKERTTAGCSSEGETAEKWIQDMVQDAIGSVQKKR